VAHFIFNFTGGGGNDAASLLTAKMWGIGDDERHRGELAPDDDVLIYVASSREFIGRAELATSVRPWTPSEAEAYPGDSPSGVLLSQVEEWNPPVTMEAVVRRIDPTGSNPYVQRNAAQGFPMGVVQITAAEYEGALAVSREAGGT
jgi:hypothetical protein